MDRIHILIWASALTDAALVVAAVVYWRRRGGSGVVTVAAVAALALLKLAVLRRLGLDSGFGIMHVVYLDLVVALPAAGAALVCCERRGRGSRFLRVVGIAGLLLAPVGAYASLVEPRRLQLERADVPLARERAGSGAVTVGVLADLQFRHVGAHEREAVGRLLRERPDVILLPGDLHQGGPSSLRAELPAIRRLLGRLSAPGGVYFVLGDVEGPAKARAQLRGTGVRLLRNETVRIRVRDRNLTLGGIELDWREPSAKRTIAALEGARGQGDVRLLVAHRPDAALTLRERTRLDLVVAGHTHGGQVSLPLVGPPMVATQVPRPVASGGLHDLGARRRIYVSRGVGLERGQAPPLRFMVPPEVTILRLG